MFSTVLCILIIYKLATTVSSLKYIEMEFPTSNKYLKQRPQKSRAAPN